MLGFASTSRHPSILSRLFAGGAACAVVAAGLIALAAPAGATVSGGTVCPDGTYPCTATTSGPAGATGQTEVIRFHTDAGLSGGWGGGSLTIYSGNGSEFPSGTGLYDIYSEGNPDTCYPGHFYFNIPLAGGTSVTLPTTYQCIGPDTWVDVIVSGMTNPTTPGTGYYAQVSTSADPTPVDTATYTITAGTAPGAPTITSATTPGFGDADLAWQPPADAGSSPITDYLVNAYAQGATTPVVFDIQSTNTSFQAYGLTDGTAYTFTVQAVNAAGPGAESTPSNSVTPLSGPDRPTNVVASKVSGTQDHVRWTLGFNGGTPVTRQIITVYLYRPGTMLRPPTYTFLRQVTLGGSARSVTIGKLSHLKRYAFTVTARNAFAAGAESSPSNIVRG